MKSILSFGATTFIVFFLICCQKNSLPANDIKSAIPGKWNIVNDSTFIGVGINNHQVSYSGQAGDYFDFRSDGFLYTKEGAVLDTLSYSLASDNTILIASFGIILNGQPGMSYISNLTAHSLTITAPIVITPGGAFGRKVNLNR
ncbi:hypothetical protein [Flavihumibacter profundi]|jgi:hypothetical protein|uniref:hypothetical protein n=1 Tax=Flavihumibacter profundi TaxID=2716883 RepID=UPI001CC60150|nr:hypothetical protein [Flavihumibacter profundi]MBZ5857308.1 hypothetical protein [Flavihumibacter profundi]